MTIVSNLPIYAMLVSFLTIFPIIIFGKNQNVREVFTFIAAFTKLYILFNLAKFVLDGNVVVCKLIQVLSFISIDFKVDGFGMLLAIVASSLWIVTSLYSIGYMRSLKEHAQTRYFCCFALALSATMGVAFSANLLTMYLFYELLSLSTYPLVTHNQDQDARTGGRKYLTYLLGTSIGLVLPAMIITYNLTGTLSFNEMGIFGNSIQIGTLTILLIMYLFGFAKAGLLPFHSWLPGAMVAPTPVSSLLHAVAVVKVGVFCIVRILTQIFGINLLSSTHLGTIVCVIAGLTVLVSSLVAISQDNLKRLLAFSTIGQLGYIVLAAGVASKLSVTGSMLHISMHAFGKITLFFCAGAIYVATGKKYISQMVGIGRRMPFTMVAFFIGSLSIIGLPLAGGFLSKWYMVLGTLDVGKSWVMVIYLISSFLNVAYFFPIIYKAFFCTDNESLFPNEIKEAPLAALLPPLVTASITVALFIFPDIFLNLAKIVVGVN
ncbi:cation:proton antiporter [Candidatus Marinamargulisbacteria bacterium SCGC AG-410-N11]|nr:cation:proton antiporter [Candidatus Marinamargulisbacteria bacterium SCGC AG-410-N11]